MVAKSYNTYIATSFRDINQAQWDACANPSDAGETLSLQGESFNPFMTYAFLSSLEEAGCATPQTGWAGSHVLLQTGDNILAAAPTYLKSHSLGEYVFDQGWAKAYEKIGGSYYPKIQVCIPFAPVAGRRLLTRNPIDALAIAALIHELRILRERTMASSLHINFPNENESNTLNQAGFLKRIGQQFHFFNQDFETFDDFLASLASRKRKAIRKEREAVRGDGICFEWITGNDLSETHWDAFFEFYLETASRKWGTPYLTRRFFSLISERLSDRILLVMARRDGRFIAGALNFIGNDALYGRHWGCIEERPFLHFEVCYYQAIDFAIAKKLKRVEAGAQGDHKIARGYSPIETYSLHEFSDPRLQTAVSDYLEKERSLVAHVIEAQLKTIPFKKI